MQVISEHIKVKITLNEDIEVKTETAASWENWEIFVNELLLADSKRPWNIQT